MAIRLRQQALEKYYRNPSLCLNCGLIIKVLDGQKVSEIKHKKFCNHSCSAAYNNIRKIRKIKLCGVCGKTCSKRASICLSCSSLSKLTRDSFKITKKELFDKTTYQSARSTIQKHARRTFDLNGKKLECKICGYSRHVEICHIKSVSDFEDNATILKINDIHNLVGLCPTHHWEFDNDFIKKEKLVAEEGVEPTCPFGTGL